MKQYILCFLLFSSLYHLNSQEFTVDNVNYKVTNSTTNTVEVTTTCYTGNLTIPGTVVNSSVTYTVTSVADFAFRLCPNIRAVTLPNTLTYIGNYAFANSELTSIVIPNSVNIIGNNAFQYCASLSSVTIPNSVSTIGVATFGNSGITTVYIPSSINTILDFAFENCTNLNTINIDVVNPVTINENVFNGVNKSSVNLNVPSISLDDYQIANVWKDFNFGTLSLEEKESNLGLKIYPNPATNMLFLKGVKGHVIKDVTIYSMQGQFIKATKEDNLDISNLKSGIYLAKVNNDIGEVFIKFIKK